MRKFKLDEKTRGWFIGNFEGASHKTKDFEVAVKKYKQGDFEAKHMHKVATELTLIVSGKVLMNEVEYAEGDIIMMEPGEATDFKALTDAVNIVVKMPSVIGDKYLVD